MLVVLLQEDADSQPAAHGQHAHTHEEHSHSHSHSDSESSHSEHSHSHSESHSHSHSHTHNHGHDHNHNHGHDHVHDDHVSSVSASVTGDLDIEKLNSFLGGLVSLVGPDLYRYKGICAMAGEDARFVFQVITSLLLGAGMLVQPCHHPCSTQYCKCMGRCHTHCCRLIVAAASESRPGRGMHVLSGRHTAVMTRLRGCVLSCNEHSPTCDFHCLCSTCQCTVSKICRPVNQGLGKLLLSAGMRGLGLCGITISPVPATAPPHQRCHACVCGRDVYHSNLLPSELCITCLTCSGASSLVRRAKFDIYIACRGFMNCVKQAMIACGRKGRRESARWWSLGGISQKM